MPVAMGLAVIMTANHYVLDVVVGGVVAMAGLAIATHSRSARASAVLGARRARSAAGRRGRRTTADRASRRQRAAPAARGRARRCGRDRGRSPPPAREARAPPPEDRRPAAALLGSLGPRAALAALRRPRRPARRRAARDGAHAGHQGPRSGCRTGGVGAAEPRRTPRRAPTSSAREWPLLDEIDPALAQRIGSAARPAQLERLIEHAATRSLDGASLHLRLLESGRLRALRAHVPLLMSWPVNHGHEVDRATCARRRRADQRRPRPARRPTRAAAATRGAGWRGGRRAAPACGTRSAAQARRRSDR